MTAGVPHRFATPYVFSGHTATAQLVVPEVAPWSAESPTRHRVVAELFDPSGDLGLRRAADLERQRDIVEHRARGQEIKVLEDHAGGTAARPRR